MKYFKFLSWLGVIAAGASCLWQNHGLDAISTILMFPMLGACAELTAFRTAVESLDQRILRSPRLGRAMFWRNMIPRGVFVKNQGVTRSTFTVKASEPQDDQSLWYALSLSGGQPTPSCDTNYEDIGVNFYERTYSPKQRRFRGPVICKADLTFMHEPEAFLNAYVDELGRVMARVQEFTLRGDFMSFSNVYVDGTKYAGPSAIATAPRAFQGLSQDALNIMATGQINVGAGSEPDGGYTTLGPNGPIFPLEIDMNDSALVLKNNSTIRDDARYASMGKGDASDESLWKAIGAERVIGNFRHVPTNIAPRLDFNSGAYVQISPFKDITAVGSDGAILTDAYVNADFGMALMLSPQVFQADIVTPTDWKFPDTSNYAGEWSFEVGGERICNPAVYDPQHERGRHFAKLSYAPKPIYPYLGAVLIYKRCTTTAQTLYCS